MTLRISRENGFITIDSASITRFDFDRYRPEESAVKVYTTAGAFDISVKELSELADQEFELAKEAIAAYAADRMIHPITEEEKKNRAELERQKQISELYKQMQEQMRGQVWQQPAQHPYWAVKTTPDTTGDVPFSGTLTGVGSAVGSAFGGLIKKTGLF